MFCPNCGAQNQDTANACAKCGFALKSTSAPKFKGTMLMMNAPPQGAPRPAAPGAPAAGPPPGAPPAAAPPAAAPPAAAPAGPKPKLKGTMIGVAPPSLGSNIGPGGAAPPAFGAPPAAAPAAPPQGYGAPPPAVGAATAAFGSPPPGFGAPPPGFGAPPAGFGAPPPGFGAPPPADVPPPAPMGGPGTAPMPMHDPSSVVNPLGGTVVADASAFGANFPPTAPGMPPHQGMPPAPMGGGYDMGGPPQGGYAAPPPPGYGDPSQGGMVPASMSGGMQPMDSMPPIPGTVGGANPIVTVLLIVATCGIYGIYLLVKGKKQSG